MVLALRQVTERDDRRGAWWERGEFALLRFLGGGGGAAGAAAAGGAVSLGGGPVPCSFSDLQRRGWEFTFISFTESSRLSRSRTEADADVLTGLVSDQARRLP